MIPNHLVEERAPILQSLIEIIHALFYRLSTLDVVVIVVDVTFVDVTVSDVSEITSVEIHVSVDIGRWERWRLAIQMLGTGLGYGRTGLVYGACLG